VLRSKKRVQHFTPPPAPVVGLPCLLTRDKASKLKRRAPRKHVLSSLFYGNGGTKFPKLTMGGGSSLAAPQAEQQ
jgi:hypothetical protein